MSAPREVESEPTAWERYQALQVERPGVGATGDWSRFCTVTDYCTRGCSECAGEARRERDAIAEGQR